MTLSAPPAATGPRSGTQTLSRGFAVVQAVADGATTLRDVAAATGLTKPTAHRLIRGLVDERVLTEDSRGIRLGPRLLAWGGRAQSQNPVVVVARPVLEELAATVKDTVHLASELSGTMTYLFKIDGTRGAWMRSRVGGTEPLTRTGVGKALLLDAPERWRSQYLEDSALARPKQADPPAPGPQADLELFLRRMDAYRAVGVAYDLEENEPGIRCVAAPVRDATGRTVAAISVSATSPYMPPERMESLRATVLEAAQRIGTGLGA